MTLTPGNTDHNQEAMHAELEQLREAAEAIVAEWNSPHDGRTERDEAVEPLIAVLSALLVEVERDRGARLHEGDETPKGPSEMRKTDELAKCAFALQELRFHAAIALKRWDESAPRSEPLQKARREGPTGQAMEAIRRALEDPTEHVYRGGLTDDLDDLHRELHPRAASLP